MSCWSDQDHLMLCGGDVPEVHRLYIPATHTRPQHTNKHKAHGGCAQRGWHGEREVAANHTSSGCIHDVICILLTRRQKGQLHCVDCAAGIVLHTGHVGSGWCFIYVVIWLTPKHGLLHHAVARLLLQLERGVDPTVLDGVGRWQCARIGASVSSNPCDKHRVLSDVCDMYLLCHYAIKVGWGCDKRVRIG